MKPQIPWLRVFVEGVVIVGSILLAFGIDAWWDGVQEQRLEREALERLDAEFAGVDAVLRAWRADHQNTLEASQELLVHTSPDGATSVSVDSIGKLVGTFIYLSTVEPPSGVLTSLIASGQLGLIRNTGLRTRLASWQALLSDVQEDEEQVTRQVETRVYPYLDSHVAFRSVAALHDWYPRAPSRFPTGFAEILRDRQFETLVESRIFFTHWTLASYDEALESVASIRSMLGEELES